MGHFLTSWLHFIIKDRDILYTFSKISIIFLSFYEFCTNLTVIILSINIDKYLTISSTYAKVISSVEKLLNTDGFVELTTGISEVGHSRPSGQYLISADTALF